MNAQCQRQLDGARRWAKANPSDPWALARALTHVRLGICGPGSKGEDGSYDATAVVNPTTGRIAYSNLKRT